MTFDLGVATKEQMENAIRYGVCVHCGWPRCAVETRDEHDEIVALNLGCSNRDCDPSLILLR